MLGIVSVEETKWSGRASVGISVSDPVRLSQPAVAGKGEVNNSYCNNGVLVSGRLVLQLVTYRKCTCYQLAPPLLSISYRTLPSHSMICCHKASCLASLMDMHLCGERGVVIECEWEIHVIMVEMWDDLLTKAVRISDGGWVHNKHS